MLFGFKGLNSSADINKEIDNNKVEQVTDVNSGEEVVTQSKTKIKETR